MSQSQIPRIPQFSGDYPDPKGKKFNGKNSEGEYDRNRDHKGLYI